MSIHFVNPIALRLSTSSIEYNSGFNFHDFRRVYCHSHVTDTHVPKATGIQSVIVPSCPLWSPIVIRNVSQHKTNASRVVFCASFVSPKVYICVYLYIDILLQIVTFLGQGCAIKEKIYTL